MIEYINKCRKALKRMIPGFLEIFFFHCTEETIYKVFCLLRQRLSFPIKWDERPRICCIVVWELLLVNIFKHFSGKEKEGLENQICTRSVCSGRLKVLAFRQLQWRSIGSKVPLSRLVQSIRLILKRTGTVIIYKVYVIYMTIF